MIFLFKEICNFAKDETILPGHCMTFLLALPFYFINLLIFVNKACTICSIPESFGKGCNLLCHFI